MVLNYEPGSQRWVFILECVKTVRTVREHPAHRMLREAGNVLTRQLLKQPFFSEAPHWIASTAFTPAQEAIVYAKMGEDLDHGTAHGLSIRVKGTSTANPV
jgi:hypothetical protein